LTLCSFVAVAPTTVMLMAQASDWLASTLSRYVCEVVSLCQACRDLGEQVQPEAHLGGEERKGGGGLVGREVCRLTCGAAGSGGCKGCAAQRLQPGARARACRRREVLRCNGRPQAPGSGQRAVAGARPRRRPARGGQPFT
jgi:hypothetical protein